MYDWSLRTYSTVDLGGLSSPVVEDLESADVVEVDPTLGGQGHGSGWLLPRTPVWLL